MPSVAPQQISEWWIADTLRATTAHCGLPEAEAERAKPKMGAVSEAGDSIETGTLRCITLLKRGRFHDRRDEGREMKQRWDCSDERDLNHWVTALDELAQEFEARGIPTYESGLDRIGFPCPIHRVEATARLKSWNCVVMSCPKGCTHDQLAEATDVVDVARFDA